MDKEKERGNAVDRETMMKTVRAQVGWMTSYKPSRLALELATGQGE